MRIKLSLRRPGGRVTDLTATLDATVLVGDLAVALASRDPDRPARPAHGLTLAIGAHAEAIDPTLTVADAGLRSGMTVGVVPAGERYAEAGSRPAAALVHILSGPLAGREIPIPAGTSYVGRDRSCDVVLDDQMVSRRHAKIHVTDVVEIVDLGSSNGVLVGGSVVPRAVIRGDDVVEIGDVQMSVTLLAASPSSGAMGSGQIAFNRSPRLDPIYAGVEMAAPEPPPHPRSQRFPMIPLLAPLVMGAVLYLVTQSVASLVFVAFSPVLMVGSVLEGRINGKRDYAEAVAAFTASLDGLVNEAERAATEERTRRCAEHPSVTECVAAARDLAPLLWTRRPEHESFLDLRLGLGSRPSRSSITLPTNRQGDETLVTQLHEVVARFASVDAVPVIARLAESGSVGVSGPRPQALTVAYSLVTQLITLHSPAEVVLAAFASTSAASDWGWLTWLPHVSSPHSPLRAGHLASNAGGASTLAAELEVLIEARQSAREDDQSATLPAVVVLVDDPPLEWNRLIEIGERGARLGVHLLWVAPATALLPAVCQTFVEVSHDSSGTAGFVETGEAVTPLRLDSVDVETVSDLARRMSPLEDAGARVDDASDLPRDVSLLALVGPQVATEHHVVIERWLESRSVLTGPFAPAAVTTRPGSLRAVIGQGATEAHAIDLRTHGPHALVGGTTGSGKSELLRSWICALALAHSPQRVNFLLVDYKGGSAFSECDHLPHTVGLVTDLSPHLVRRTLTSLNAELRYREQVLRAKRVKDLPDLEKAGDPDAPPSLIIVVDEFAALVQEVPEFIDGVVNVAQRGRSLGLHLILATQRPNGVIKDNLRANTNLRLALRMADEADSSDVLGSPIAASFDPTLPGRAVVKSGPGRLARFQSAYVSGRTAAEPPPPQILLEELVFGQGRRWEADVEEEARTEDELGPLDLARIVDTVNRAAATAALPTPRRPWLDVLAPTYDLTSDHIAKSWVDSRLAFGLVDDPDNQSQPIVEFFPDRDGNLAVYGTGGSGKSTLLRSIAVAASFTRKGGPCHVYGLDLGARGLQMLEGLPHVGSIIDGNDHERTGRLLTWLRALIDERALRYSSVAAGTITEYRERAHAPDETRILLLVDGIAAFRQIYEVGEHAKLFDALLSIAADGRPAGVHVIVSADRSASVPSALSSSVQRRVVLRLANEDEYSVLGLPADVLSAESPPGRGLVDGRELQVAVIGGSADIGVQSAATAALGAAMVRAGAQEAVPIRRLPDEVRLSDLPAEVDGEPVLGLASSTLAPIPMPSTGAFLVAGPPGSGRTTTLMSIVESLRRARPDLRLVYFGSRRSPLSGMGLWEVEATSSSSVDELAAKLTAEISADPEGLAPLCIVVEAVNDFVNGPSDFALQELLRVALREGQLVVAEGETSSLGSSFPLLMLLKSSRTGIALQPDQMDGTTLFRTGFPRTNRANFPPGRGLAVRHGRTEVVQVAMPG